MTRKENAVVLALGLIILGAVVYLLMFAPLGTLGSADGQSYEVDRFGIIGFIVFCLVIGYLFVHRRVNNVAGAKEHEAEPEDAIWPPPPTSP